MRSHSLIRNYWENVLIAQSVSRLRPWVVIQLLRPALKVAATLWSAVRVMRSRIWSIHEESTDRSCGLFSAWKVERKNFTSHFCVSQKKGFYWWPVRSTSNSGSIFVEADYFSLPSSDTVFIDVPGRDDLVISSSVCFVAYCWYFIDLNFI